MQRLRFRSKRVNYYPPSHLAGSPLFHLIFQKYTQPHSQKWHNKRFENPYLMRQYLTLALHLVPRWLQKFDPRIQRMTNTNEAKKLLSKSDCRTYLSEVDN